MAQGDVLKPGTAIYESYTMKTDTDAVKGKLYCDDGSGNGLVLATAALAATNKVVMPVENHDYSENTSHIVNCVREGLVEAAKISGSGAAKRGQKITISATPGACTKFVKGDAPTGGASTYYTATIETGVQSVTDTNLATIGDAYEDSENADTTQKFWLK
jgi:histone acetyltransferase (RNA polymerase elongator complex component)